MGQPAVPTYVGAEFADCPPGHRFNLYFPVWKPDWQIDKTGKAAALRQCLALGSAKAALDAIRARQQAQADALPEARRLVIDALSTSPFATGLGLEHPIENGFAFLSPYGLPYLAGSGVKGVLRRAAEDLCDGGEFDQTVVDVLFGHEDANDARRGALACWDVFPAPPGDRLTVEIMTPHFGHYYQDGDPPHDAGKPNPIPFLAVPAGSKFRFVVVCEPGLLTDAVPDWKAALNHVVEHAFDWLGFGAKTAVGYGAMAEDAGVKAQRQKAADDAAKQKKQAEEQDRRDAELAQMSPAMRTVGEFLDARADKNQPELSALLGGLKQGKFDGEHKREVARHVEALMRAANKWKEKSEKKKPEKDNDYQDTLKVMVWLQGK